MMNKQQALCLSLVSLLMSPAYSVAMEKAGGNGANPVSVAVMLAAGAVTTAAGYQSIESIKGMLKDIENGKQQETSLDEDLRNCAKVVGLCTGLVGLGGAFMRDGDTPTYMQGTLGSSVIAGSLFLLLKHGLDNPSLRLREVMGTMVLSGAASAFLAKYGLALRF